MRLIFCIALLLATATAHAGTSWIELVPESSGPYQPGSFLDVDVVFHNMEGQTIQVRLVTLDFSVTDAALSLPGNNHCRFFGRDFIFGHNLKFIVSYQKRNQCVLGGISAFNQIYIANKNVLRVDSLRHRCGYQQNTDKQQPLQRIFHNSIPVGRADLTSSNLRTDGLIGQNSGYVQDCCCFIDLIMPRNRAKLGLAFGREES